MRRTTIALVLAAGAVLALADPALADEWDDCLQDRNLELSVATCSRIINRSGTSAEHLVWALNGRGISYNAQKRFDTAKADFDRALQLNPQDAIVLTSRGALLNDMEKHQLAIADLDKAVAIDPKHWRAFNNRGYAYEKLGQRDRAVAEYKRALTISPGNPIPKENLKRLGIR